MNKVSLMSFVLFYSSIYALESCPVHPWTKTFMSIHPLLCFVHVPPSQEQPCPSIGQPLKTFMNSWVQSVLVLPQLKTSEPILVWVWRKRLYPSQPFSEFLQSKTTPATSPSPRRFIHQLFKVSSSQSGHAPILLPLTPVPCKPMHSLLPYLLFFFLPFPGFRSSLLRFQFPNATQLLAFGCRSFHFPSLRSVCHHAVGVRLGVGPRLPSASSREKTQDQSIP